MIAAGRRFRAFILPPTPETDRAMRDSMAGVILPPFSLKLNQIPPDWKNFAVFAKFPLQIL